MLYGREIEQNTQTGGHCDLGRSFDNMRKKPRLDWAENRNGR